MASGSEHRWWWIAAELAGLIAIMIIPPVWGMFAGAIVALLLPIVMLAIWHWSSPEQKQRVYGAEATIKDQKGPLNRNGG